MKRLWKILILMFTLTVVLSVLSGCSAPEETVDLTGKWKGTGSGASGLRATISSGEIVIKYEPTSDMEKVIWSGSYEPPKGNPPAFVSANDYKYTRYAGTIDDETLTFTFEDDKLSFEVDYPSGRKHYTLVRND